MPIEELMIETLIRVVFSAPSNIIPVSNCWITQFRTVVLTPVLFIPKPVWFPMIANPAQSNSFACMDKVRQELFVVVFLGIVALRVTIWPQVGIVNPLTMI